MLNLKIKARHVPGTWYNLDIKFTSGIRHKVTERFNIVLLPFCMRHLNDVAHSLQETTSRLQKVQDCTMYFSSSHTCAFQLLVDTPWSQASSLFLPRSCFQIFSRIWLSNPIPRRFFIECCKLTLSRFPQVAFCTSTIFHEFIRVCTRRDSNSRN